MKRLALLLAAAFLCPGCGGGSAASEKTCKETQQIMGTFVTITVVADDSRRAEVQAAVDRAFDAMREVDRLMSNYREDSEVSRINRGAFAAPVKVSGWTFAVIKRSIEVSRATDGAFDITVGPLMRLWRDAEKAGAPPSAEAINDALKKVGAADKVLLDEEQKTVGFLVEGMEIDLGGIAKGYAVDRAVEALRAAGVSAIVEAGGDLTAIGKNAGGRKWIVGVRNFFRREGHVERLALEDRSIATSGDYERYCEIGGRRYSHIIDPRTGMPVVGAASVSVIGPDCETADALATAASVLGFRRAASLPEESGIFAGCEILFASCTHGFRGYLVPDGAQE